MEDYKCKGDLNLNSVSQEYLQKLGSEQKSSSTGRNLKEIKIKLCLKRFLRLLELKSGRAEFFFREEIHKMHRAEEFFLRDSKRCRVELLNPISDKAENLG